MSSLSRKIEIIPPDNLGCCTDWHWSVLEWSDTPIIITDLDLMKKQQTLGSWYNTGLCGHEDSSKLAYYAAMEALQKLQDKDKTNESKHK